MPYRTPQTVVAVVAPVDIRYSRFKSLVEFLRESAEEGLIEIDETERGLVVTGKDQFRVVEGSLRRLRYRCGQVTPQCPITHSPCNFNGRQGETGEGARP